MTSAAIYVLLFLIFVRTVETLQCLQCNGDYRGVRCSNPCFGEVCAVWKWQSRSELLLKQGCISGVDRRFTAKVGCRTNMLGASLCLCKDGDLCNTLNRTETTLRPLPIVRLPIVDCSSRVTGTGHFGSRRENICTANYCHMMKTETFSKSSAPDFLSLYNCADEAEFDFDVRLKNTVNFPGLYANGCYKIQTHSREMITDCTCSKNNCNSGIPVVVSGPVRCYMGRDGKNDTEIEKHHFCDGDYCFIQHSNKKFTKGCISVNERNTWSHLKNGHRHIVGVDQWLCQSHLCNLNLERVQKSLQPHRARMRSIKNVAVYDSCFVVLLLTAYYIFL